jgi:hypothetical protein
MRNALPQTSGPLPETHDVMAYFQAISDTIRTNAPLMVRHLLTMEALLDLFPPTDGWGFLGSIMKGIASGVIAPQEKEPIVFTIGLANRIMARKVAPLLLDPARIR